MAEGKRLVDEMSRLAFRDRMTGSSAPRSLTHNVSQSASAPLRRRSTSCQLSVFPPPGVRGRSSRWTPTNPRNHPGLWPAHRSRSRRLSYVYQKPRSTLSNTLVPLPSSHHHSTTRWQPWANSRLWMTASIVQQESSSSDTMSMIPGHIQSLARTFPSSGSS